MAPDRMPRDSIKLTLAELTNIFLGHAVERTANGRQLVIQCQEVSPSQLHAVTPQSPLTQSDIATLNSSNVLTNFVVEPNDEELVDSSSPLALALTTSNLARAPAPKVSKLAKECRDQGIHLQYRPPLLRLPPEIRNTIYQLLYPGDLIKLKPPVIRNEFYASIFPDLPMCYLHNTGLLAACHQLRAEATCVYYHSNKFSVEEFNLVKWAEALSLASRAALTEVRLIVMNFDTNFMRFKSLIKRLDYCKSVGVQIPPGVVRLRLKSANSRSDWEKGPNGEEVWSSTFVA